jgi:quinol monooxygenase YgiN
MENTMAIYTIAQYQVNSQAIEKVKRAIEEFVRYVKVNEPGTQMYVAWQQKDNPTRFVHFFIFADEAALAAHSESEAVKRFESIYSPELVSGDVVFTDYELVAANGKWLGGSTSI